MRATALLGIGLAVAALALGALAVAAPTAARPADGPPTVLAAASLSEVLPPELVKALTEVARGG